MVDNAKQMCRHINKQQKKKDHFTTESLLMTCFLKVTVCGSYSSCSGKLLYVNHEHLLQEKNGFNTVWTEQQRRIKDDE